LLYTNIADDDSRENTQENNVLPYDFITFFILNAQYSLSKANMIYLF